MSRNLFQCPVDKCPCLREAGELFCSRHWNMIKPADQRYFNHYIRLRDREMLSSLVKAQAAVFSKNTDTPAPLTGGV